MRALHANWAYVVVASNLIVGIWGLVAWRRHRPASRRFWIALGAAWAAIYIQGILGLLVYEKSVPLKHTFYGFLFVIVTLMVLPVRSENPRTRLGVFSAATLFIGIVAVRAIISG